MDSEEFRKWGKYTVDYICEYMKSVENRPVIPEVEPGYLQEMLPVEASEKPEKWSEIVADFDRCILPGITHWQHPRFHAYFPAGNSYPSIMGDMLSDALGCVGFSWASCPAMAELEIVVLDQLARLMKLPEHFLHSSGEGGGVLQSSASDCILLSLLAARHEAVERYKHRFADHPNPEHAVLERLVAYCSCLAHSSVEKAGVITFVKMRHLSVDDSYSMRGSTVMEAIEQDLAKGLIPFYVCATLGTTSCGSFDALEEIGPICRDNDMWVHVDAAYAGSSFICPEMRANVRGLENVCSLEFNPNKWMLVNFDCSVFWVRSRQRLTHSLIVDPVYLQHKHSTKAVDFRHWGIPLSRRFRILKMWFVMRAYGAEGLRSYIRLHTSLAKYFAELVHKDPRFEVVGKTHLGLACFRLKGSNILSQWLIREMNESGVLHMVPAVVKDKYIIRFVVCREDATEDDITHAWSTITKYADRILQREADLRKWECIKDNTCETIDVAERHVNDEGLIDVGLRLLAEFKASGNTEEYHSLAEDLFHMGADNIEFLPPQQTDDQGSPPPEKGNGVHLNSATSSPVLRHKHSSEKVAASVELLDVSSCHESGHGHSVPEFECEHHHDSVACYSSACEHPIVPQHINDVLAAPLPGSRQLRSTSCYGNDEDKDDFRFEQHLGMCDPRRKSTTALRRSTLANAIANLELGNAGRLTDDETTNEHNSNGNKNIVNENKCNRRPHTGFPRFVTEFGFH